MANQSTGTRFLVKHLVVPLFLAAGLTLLLSVFVPEPWAGLLINLAAGFVGTILTVFYVDVVLRQHDAARWSKVKIQVNERVMRLANLLVLSVRVALGVEWKLGNLNEAMSTADGRRRVSVKIAEDLSHEDISQIRKLDKTGWEELMNGLQRVSDDATLLVGTYGSHLDADLIEQILDLQDTVRGVSTTYSIAPDYFGVPADKLPPKTDGSSAAASQDGFYKVTEKNLASAIEIATELLRSIDEQRYR